MTYDEIREKELKGLSAVVGTELAADCLRLLEMDDPWLYEYSEAVDFEGESVEDIAYGIREMLKDKKSILAEGFCDGDEEFRQSIEEQIELGESILARLKGGK